VAELLNWHGVQVLNDQNQDHNASDFQEVRSKKKKKNSRGSNSTQGQQAASGTDH